ncbi:MULTISPECIES: recombination regulator RecX [Geobacillus]|jgi:regulatory protein|uniref:Regulatory protein RecX n=3 Tax=Geobacillus thermodenitrificans TaxID=33940 RepID=RECX_GEOTN|nr:MULTISPECIES: recombination regulator RecX [Geobacillus]A4IKI6.1 RecName: Full=Regulatory protein RecX [Geobacillus thermodenitrificans NG80-2]ABO65840.1 Regulatory protein RecX [Geobacillus thermodenitrificans NG80-2]ARA97717.1 recombination regulator RecX [Geobacillus thermodenitrificans]ARP41552.1 Regulatory protein RecX [Geobacillus thermodenitrificans]ATO37054.1 recombination regulator RecX [Geobacillus thermodenitrificans]KQB94539.1 Regulatory protein RecX [Geobacillus sp. PA-3]
MGTIVDITVTKENAERFWIVIHRDNESALKLTVDQDVLLKFRLKKGMIIDDALLRDIVYADGIKKAYQQALYFLAHRMRSEQEIVEHLRKKGVVDPVIEEVLEKLRAERYVDDEAFAAAYVRTQKNTSTKGPRLIQAELERLGVPASVIEQSLVEYSFNEQVIAARSLYEKAKKQRRAESARAFLERVKQQLMRKGFSHEVIAIVLADGSGHTEEEEREALHVQAEKIRRRYAHHPRPLYEQKMRQALYRKGFSLALIDEWLRRQDDDG